MTTQCLQIASAILAFSAAGFWAASALISVPDLMQTKLSGEGSITSIMKKQAHLSALGAGAAALSALLQGVSLISN
ncbi:MAG: hypothetical protein AB7E05_12530 [Sphingobium sp.]